MEGITTVRINAWDYDIVYSPDDGGYYWHRWETNTVSDEIFGSEAEAIEDARCTRRIRELTKPAR